MQVTEITDGVLARCRVGEGDTYVTASLLLLPEPPRVGEYVIVHAGFALHIVTPEEAEESLRLLRQIADGGDLAMPG
jgi:hydrogenase expression/formation protein HypC